MDKRVILAIIILITIPVVYMAYSRGGNSNIQIQSIQANPDRVNVGGKAPQFTVKSLDGGQISLSDFRGKPVILWFMASWCPSCTLMADTISKAISGSDVVVIVIDMWSRDFLKSLGIEGKPGYPPPDTSRGLEAFLERYGDPGWIAVLDDGSLVRLYDVKYIDTVVVIDGSGYIRFKGSTVTVDVLKRYLGG